jgi:hypothetical protein
MPIRTAKIEVGVWDVPTPGTRYRYRVVTTGKGHKWTIYRIQLERVANEDASPDGPTWVLVKDGFKSKASAVEMVEELAELEEITPPYDALLDNIEKVNPVSDFNIDDGIDLNEDNL